MTQPLDRKNRLKSGDLNSPFELFIQFEDKDTLPLDLADYRIPFPETTMDRIRKNLKEPLEKIKDIKI